MSLMLRQLTVSASAVVVMGADACISHCFARIDAGKFWVSWTETKKDLGCCETLPCYSCLIIYCTPQLAF